MLIDWTSEDRELSINTNFIDFGFADSGRFSDSKQLTLRNKFPFPVQASWSLL